MQNIILQLKRRIKNSSYISKHTNQKAIKVNVFDYEELSIVDGKLVFLDAKGDYSSLFADCEVEDLIDILNKLEVEITN